MNIGIIGLPQAGKKTLFKLLVGEEALRGHADARRPRRGVADLMDPRFDRLIDIYRPRKQTRARLEVELLPSVEENAIRQGEIFKDMGQVEALCHVVRAFDNETVYHIWGKPDPVREIEFVQSELILHDLLFVEKRLERIASDLKKIKDEKRKREQIVLLRFKDHLEAEMPLRRLEVSLEEAAIISSYPFLTLRQTIVALNVSEEKIADDAFVGGLAERFADFDLSLVCIAVKAESDIAEFETEAERAEFMEEMGISDTALHVLTSKFIDAVGLVSFFTATHAELQQWFVRRGALAPEAAGKIHGDMERGFIRAEVVHYDDIVEYGGEDAVKAAGKYHVKGKDYEIRDGDILNILFSV